MNKDEFKKKFLEFGNSLIDSYFPPETSVVNKLVNNTCKYIAKTKLSDLDPIISMFADVNDNIDVVDFVNYMQTNMIGDGIRINLCDYVDHNGYLYKILPNRTLIITKEDMNCFL